MTPDFPAPSTITVPLMLAVRLIMPGKLASAVASVATGPVQLVPSSPKSISSSVPEMSTWYVPASRSPNVYMPSASVAPVLSGSLLPVVLVRVATARRTPVPSAVTVTVTLAVRSDVPEKFSV